VVATVPWYFEVISDHNIVEAFSLRFVIQFDLDIRTFIQVIVKGNSLNVVHCLHSFIDNQFYYGMVFGDCKENC